MTKFEFSEPKLPKNGTVVVGILDDRKLTPSAETLDKALDGTITRAMAASKFRGKKEQTLSMLAAGDYDRVVLLGLGDPKKLDDQQSQKLGGIVLAGLNGAGAKDATVMIDGTDGSKLSAADIAANMAAGAGLRSYRFDAYRTKEKADKKPSLKVLTFGVKDAGDATKAFKPLSAVTEGVFLTRDLVSEPPNVIFPATLAERIHELEKYDLDIEILDEPAMEKLGMGALLGVGQGSAQDPRLVIMRWNGGKDGDAPLAFCGKGVTFDSGGLSIKPAGGMEDMKWDMGGSAVVTGLMKALALRKAKVNAVGVVGLVENMPSGTAQRPGDIVKSMSGQTIEVLNTDAEGRLVLADVLWYTQERYKPKFMIDLATLTGAIIVALGEEYAGLFSNNDDLAKKLEAAGKAVNEPLWRMPMGDVYDKMIDSDAADMKNIGGGRAGGSITAAQFLQRFVNKLPWAHLDIAGVTWSKKDAAIAPKGGTGYGVRLLDRFVADNYEGN